ncbi:(2E,6E)-farnesyl diphosphate synthase [Labrys miyagiensis]|uniref:(2E,6E)-farnesyl diphosphate synthase n=1 Tax=Labrys miyagiensis TaxID=346912 RepID=A0ABQ6CAY6_9HYPH|nr:farnesyl diphosphate synthase [Labrys miyagiensis]GLS17364.1 (2E,6E)-farnesyl diphosphate synthase [Labrys miyagiensis]
MNIDFHQRLASVASEIEDVLVTIFDVATDPPVPARLLNAMRYAALGGGKRLRPFLVVETANLLNGDSGAALRAGAAIEFVHVYSLAHDDLPAMDDDDLRRGKPTLHLAFDEATAILAGDTLQTLAFETLSDPATSTDPAMRAELVLLLARAAGGAGMAGGQMLDLEAEGRFSAEVELNAHAIRQLQAMKTGAILSCAVEMGATIGRANAQQYQALLSYGRALGAAFQIADDILDVESSSAELGKATGKDAGRGKGTLVGLWGLGKAKAELARLVDEAVHALALFGEEADILRAAAHFTAERRS